MILSNLITEFEKPNVPIDVGGPNPITFEEWLRRESVRIQSKKFHTAIVETAEYGSLALAYSSVYVSYWRRVKINEAQADALRRGEDVEVRQ